MCELTFVHFPTCLCCISHKVIGLFVLCRLFSNFMSLSIVYLFPFYLSHVSLSAIVVSLCTNFLFVIYHSPTHFLTYHTGLIANGSFPVTHPILFHLAVSLYHLLCFRLLLLSSFLSAHFCSCAVHRHLSMGAIHVFLVLMLLVSPCGDRYSFSKLLMVLVVLSQLLSLFVELLSFPFRSCDSCLSRYPGFHSCSGHSCHQCRLFTLHIRAFLLGLLILNG